MKIWKWEKGAKRRSFGHGKTKEEKRDPLSDIGVVKDGYSRLILYTDTSSALPEYRLGLKKEREGT